MARHKKSQFFEIDAMIAVAIIFVGVFYILSQPLQETPISDLMTTYAEDLMYIMKRTPMGALDSSLLDKLEDDYDPEKTVAEQICIYWLLSQGYDKQANEVYCPPGPDHDAAKCSDYITWNESYRKSASTLAQDLVPQIIPPDINSVVSVSEDYIYSSSPYDPTDPAIEDKIDTKIPQREVMASVMATDYQGKYDNLIVQAPETPIVFTIIVWKNKEGTS